ncbi:MAG: nucleotide exchange factor GrpE [Nitrospinota bacterium]|nr:nucleotide exchange factor GrpE [Nitrospinota bacterium]
MSKKEIKEETPKGGGDASSFKVNDKRISVDGDIPNDSEGGEKPEDRLPSYIAELKKNAEESEAKLKEYIVAYKEKLAENDAFRKRLENDFMARGEKIKGEVLSSFLSFANNLDRAVDAIPADRSDSISAGINMVRNMFWDCMLSHGVEHIETEGMTFDPNISEAIMAEEVSDKAKDNLVLAELEKGYRIGDRLLRAAKVKVAVFRGGDQ